MVVGIVLAAAVAVWAGDFWVEKDYQRWSEKECRKLLEDSPWARGRVLSEVYITPLQIGPTDPMSQPDAGDPTQRERQGNPRIEYRAQLRSALPVRQALVRLHQIRQSYDQMSPQQKQAFDTEAEKFLSVSFADTVVVYVGYTTTVQGDDRELAFYWQKQTTDTLKNFVFLIGGKGQKIPMLRYAVAEAGRAFQFVFPRVYEEQPVVEATDKNLKLDFEHPGVRGQGNQRILLEFPVKKMLLQGVLVY